jgi:hypothetical protein
MHFAANMQAEAAKTQEVSFSSSLASQQHSSQTTPRDTQGASAEGIRSAAQQQQQKQQQQQQQGGARAAQPAASAGSQLLQRIESHGISGLWRRSPSMEGKEEQQVGFNLNSYTC